jgi:hypothetical protein
MRLRPDGPVLTSHCVPITPCSHTPKGAASRTARGSSDAGGSSGSGSSAPARQTLAAAALHLPAVARHHAATHPAQPAADGGLGPPGGSGGSSSSGSGAQSGRAGSTAAAGSSGSSSSDPALSGAGARPSWAPALVPAAPLSSAADPWLLQHVQQLSPAGLQPPWQRPRPPLLAASPGEFKWVHTELPQVLLWDNTMGEDPRRGQVGRAGGGEGVVAGAAAGAGGRLHKGEKEGCMCKQVAAAPAMNSEPSMG